MTWVCLVNQDVCTSHQFYPYESHLPELEDEEQGDVQHQHGEAQQQAEGGGQREEGLEVEH